MIVTSASYGLATVVLKTCNELRPPEYSVLREVADDPSLWGGVTLVGVITGETFATTVNLSIAQALRYMYMCIHVFFMKEKIVKILLTIASHSLLIPVIIEKGVLYSCSGCAQNEAIWKVLDGDSVYTLDFDEVSYVPNYHVRY